MYKFLLFFILFVSINTINAQNRLKRPIQLQTNFSGALLSVTANSLADETVDDVKVNKWRPGIDIGYHVNRFVYLGYSLSSSLDLTLKEEWGFTNVAQDGNIVLDHKTGVMHSIETRISPFKFGLYVSLAYINIGKVDYDMKFRRKSDTMLIGDNNYQTDLDVTWNSKRVNRAGLGLGYNHVFKFGLSFNIGLTVPLGFPDDENIEFFPVNNSGLEIQPDDLAKAEVHLQNETFYGPIFLLVNVGYNFSKR
jgi:hypothetical protein